MHKKDMKVDGRGSLQSWDDEGDYRRGQERVMGMNLTKIHYVDCENAITNSLLSIINIY